MDQAQIEYNITLEQALRRADLLAAAAQVSQNLTQIMDIDQLLPKTVDIICDAYNFYYAGVFLINDTGDFAVLQAGRGEPGRIMIENHHKLAVGGNSMIGACTAFNEARISLDVDTEKVWYPNPVLPETRSEMALPLAVGKRVIGAVTVQSVEAAAFSDEDISSLQAMANQLAIAIDNARKRRELEEAHAELVQAKTFQAIAAATGDAIHWIGNKSEPIGGSVGRIREDVKLLVLAVADLFNKPEIAPQLEKLSVVQLIQKEAALLLETEPELQVTADNLSSLPLKKLEKRLSVRSIQDDLGIIDDAARLIIKVKEDLIGPAREQAPRPTMIDDVFKDALTGLGLPSGLVTVTGQNKLPLVVADPVQLNRVFVNLLKNAVEAMDDQAKAGITVVFQPDKTSGQVKVSITDTGVGIAPEDMDKIWITFHSTKGIKGHSGLGLPACKLILEQIGGTIAVESTPKRGTTFIIAVPVFTAVPEISDIKGKSKMLLIDDEDNWAKFAFNALLHAGFKVTVSPPQSGLSNLGGYDLILMDDILSGADSMALLEKIKAAGSIGKVLVVSSNPRVERTKERMLVGVKNLVPKPYTSMGLLETVISVL
jgi:signal transduction histidine kinase